MPITIDIIKVHKYKILYRATDFFYEIRNKRVLKPLDVCFKVLKKSCVSKFCSNVLLWW